jgi:hypothetical protein
LMNTFSFASWREELERAEMPPSARKSAEITIHWYLGYLRKRREPASIESARAFLAEVMRLWRRRPTRDREPTRPRLKGTVAPVSAMSARPSAAEAAVPRGTSVTLPKTALLLEPTWNGFSSCPKREPNRCPKALCRLFPCPSVALA